MTDAPRTPDTEELITQLEATIARAGVQAEAETLQEADRLLEELRVAYLSLGADERAALASRVIPLADLRTRLASRTSGNTPSNEDAPAARSPDAALALLGVSAFRPGQREAIVAVLSGRDALVVMATGSGKSLCYQVPALSADGLTIVVSPLIALIRDQFERLAATGAPVCMLSSNQSSEDSVTALRAIARGEMRVVFCAPERFAHASFLRAVKANRVDLFVVDEAHCLVEWGDDFRPEYARLAEWRDELEARGPSRSRQPRPPKSEPRSRAASRFAHRS